MLADAAGALIGGSVGQLAPGVSATAAVHAELADGPIDCVWMCTDSKERLHVWSYDGRHKRLDRHRSPSNQECFQMMYES